MSIDEDTINQFRSQFSVLREKLQKHRSEFSGKGATIWDLFLRADKELLELAQRLRSTNGNYNFNEYIRLQSELISYLKVLENYGLIKATGVNLSDIRYYENLQKKYLKAQDLISKINEEEARVKLLKNNFIRAKEFLTNYYAKLKSDKDLNPVEVDRKLEDKSLQSRAYLEFSKLAGQNQTQYLQDHEVKALLPSSTEDKITGLDGMIVKYNIGVIYVGFAENAIQQISSNIETIKRDLEQNHITSKEREDLEKFKKGEHHLYNFGNYAANYWRTVMGNVINFFKEAGIKNITINL